MLPLKGVKGGTGQTTSTPIEGRDVDICAQSIGCSQDTCQGLDVAASRHGRKDRNVTACGLGDLSSAGEENRTRTDLDEEVEAIIDELGGRLDVTNRFTHVVKPVLTVQMCSGSRAAVTLEYGGISVGLPRIMARDSTKSCSSGPMK